MFATGEFGTSLELSTGMCRYQVVIIRVFLFSSSMVRLWAGSGSDEGSPNKPCTSLDRAEEDVAPFSLYRHGDEKGFGGPCLLGYLLWYWVLSGLPPVKVFEQKVQLLCPKFITSVFEHELRRSPV